ncbi:MAG: LacI family transcriptional regulator [Synergistaceae bacterium]|nr:LacI family transcriptional regulator [Synergistaceae bacterium]
MLQHLGRMPPRPTMEDVARQAGVNKATVSRALRGDSRISSATSEKVWRAAKDLGYRLDRTASSLSGGRTGLAAVVLEEPDPWLSPAFFSGLSRVFSRASLDILLKMAGGGKKDIFSSLAARKVDCILWAGSDAPFATNSPEIYIPMVTLGFSLPPIPSVRVIEDETLLRLREVAEGKELRLFSGPRPLFPFLSRCIPRGTPGEKHVFSVFDGVPPQGLRGCHCTSPEAPQQAGLFRLEWPASEMGAMGGRRVLNVLSGNRTLPEVIWLPPLLKAPGGEIIPYVKEG